MARLVFSLVRAVLPACQVCLSASVGMVGFGEVVEVYRFEGK